jgi:hypothetical protein
MTQQIFPLPVDKTLTVDNARPRGYTLVCDVLPAFIRENRELMATLAAEGCVLGEGSAGNRAEALGLYQPLRCKAS